MIELSELRDAAQKAFPADKLMPERDAAWQLCAEMGWLLLEVPEELGGLGLGREAAATIHYEMGRVLSTAPLIPALLGLRAVCAADGLADKAGWVERLCAGEYAPLHLLPARMEGNADQGFSGTISGVFEADMASHVVAGLPGCYALIPLDELRHQHPRQRRSQRKPFPRHDDGHGIGKHQLAQRLQHSAA